MNVFITALIAFEAGFGVYRSCTRYANILPAALAIDAAMTGILIAVLYWVGALTNTQ